MSETTGWSKGMKVINTWDGEPARTPTQIIRDWYAAYKDEMNLGGIDGFHTTELMAALGVLFAAGPVRNDIDNCPLNQEVLMRRPDGMHYVAVWNAPPVFDRERHPNAPIAFATINRPEIER
jgi:hypothetical protein